MELSTTNSNCFTYQTEELLIELLGEIKIDGLDRMRVTMKVTVINRKHKEYLTNPELAGLSYGNIIKGSEWDGSNSFIEQAVKDLTVISNTNEGKIVVKDL